MRYEGQIYRPPCEAHSLIVQVTIGCPWNRCTFCGMYKDRRFRTRPIDDVLDDLRAARHSYRHVPSIFLADGNTIALPTRELRMLLEEAYRLFPELEHVGTYGGARYLAQDLTPPAGDEPPESRGTASSAAGEEPTGADTEPPGDPEAATSWVADDPGSVQRGIHAGKTVGELVQLREAGLSVVYLGLESGDEEVLRRVKKGVTPTEMVAAGRKLKEAGFPVSLYVLVGLGGRDRYREHALGTAAVINAIAPDIVRPRTLYIQEDTPLWHQRRRGEFVEAGPREALLETRLLLENITVPVTLVSDHITNYLPLHGRLPHQRDQLIAAIDRTLAESDLGSLRPAHFEHL
ncbi:MAG: radical SAM protein [Actinobacteria bacterium]|nr:radical SAM protein [Actinomycetota bacterium]